MANIRPADGTAIVAAANAWRAADLEFQAADEAAYGADALRTIHHNQEDESDCPPCVSYNDAQEAYNAARATLAALCDTRLRPYEATA